MVFGSLNDTGQPNSSHACSVFNMVPFPVEHVCHHHSTYVGGHASVRNPYRCLSFYMSITIPSKTKKRWLRFWGPGSDHPQRKGRSIYGCGSKNRYQNGTLVSGNMDQNLRNPYCFILSHTHMEPTASTGPPGGRQADGTCSPRLRSVGAAMPSRAVPAWTWRGGSAPCPHPPRKGTLRRECGQEAKKALSRGKKGVLIFWGQHIWGKIRSEFTRVETRGEQHGVSIVAHMHTRAQNIHDGKGVPGICKGPYN